MLPFPILLPLQLTVIHTTEEWQRSKIRKEEEKLARCKFGIYKVL